MLCALRTRHAVAADSDALGRSQRCGWLAADAREREAVQACELCLHHTSASLIRSVCPQIALVPLLSLPGVRPRTRHVAETTRCGAAPTGTSGYRPGAGTAPLRRAPQAPRSPRAKARAG